MCLFINGLPIATLELKDGLTRQSVDDAMDAYKAIDASAEPLFQPGRCMAHFAVDEQQVYVCADLRGEKSVFRTFNQGSSDAAGNPPNLFGIASDYLWRQNLTRTRVLISQSELRSDDGVCGRANWSRVQGAGISALPPARAGEPSTGPRGAAQCNHRYLIRHSDGSGTSYSIAWLVSQLIGLQQDSIRIFDATFVISERRSLERRWVNSVRGFAG